MSIATSQPMCPKCRKGRADITDSRSCARAQEWAVRRRRRCRRCKHRFSTIETLWKEKKPFVGGGLSKADRETAQAAIKLLCKLLMRKGGD